MSKNSMSTDKAYIDYQAIYENLQVGLHIYHLENIDDDCTLRMISANNAAVDFTGVPVEDVIGKTIDENFPRLRDQGIPQKYAEVVRTGKPISFENILYSDDRVIQGAFAAKAFPLPNNCMGVSFENVTEQKRVSEELKRSEERFRELFERMPSGVAVYEPIEDGRDFLIKNFNHGAEKIEQISREELIGKRVTDIFPGVAEFGLIDVIRRVMMTGMPEEYPITVYKDDRIKGWRENIVYKLPSGEIVAIYDDITERKQAEEEIEKSQSELKNLLQTIQAGVVVHDMKRNRITDINSAALLILGLTKEEIFGKSTVESGWEFIHENGEPMMVDEYPVNIVRRTKKPLLDYIFGIEKSSESEPTWVMVNASPQFDKEGNLSQVIVSSMDITSLKKMTMEKDSAEKRFRKVFDQAPLGIAVIDSISGRFMQINDALCDICGYSKKDMLSTDFMTITHPDDLQEDLDNMARLKRGEIAKFNMNKRYYKKNGRVVWVSLTVVPLWDQESIPLHHLAIVEDITDRKKAEETITKNAETLKRAQRSATIGSWWYDPETQMPTWTEEMFHIFGLEPQSVALHYKEHQGIIHPEDWDRFDSAVNQAITRGVGYNLELRITCPNGDIRWVRAICDPVKDEENGTVVQLLGTMQDITTYKQNENRLKEYQYLIEESNDQFALIDKNHKYRLINEKYAKANKLNKDDLIGSHIRDVLGNQYYEIYAKPYLEKAFHGTSQQFVATHQYSDNEYSYLLTRYYPISNLKGEINRVAKVILDITTQKKAEEMRDRILTLSQDLICIAGMDGYLKYVNPAWKKVLGYSEKELLAKPFLDFIHPDDHGPNNNEVKRLSEGNKTENFENRYICKDGSIRHILWTATSIVSEKLMVCIGRDITERKTTEKEIRSHSKTLETVFNASPSILAIVDGERRIKKINKKGREISGQTGLLSGEVLCCVHALTGQGFGLKHSCEDCVVRSKIMSTFHTGESCNEEEGQITIHYGGRETTIDLLISTSQLAVEGEICVLVSLSDISKLKQAERKNLQLESTIQQAQKMESIGNLAGGIAHDFNNILFPIIGMSEILLEDLPDRSPEHENAEEIFKAGKRGSALVKQILEFSRQSEHKMVPTRIQRILNEVLKLSRSTIPANIEIHQDIHPDCGMVFADTTQIHQVAMNIITNAYHAVEKRGGKISVKLEEILLKDLDWPDIHLKPGRYVLLSVSDTGHGMSNDLMKKIFDPYFTTKELGKGTGLGLAVVYGIIRKHKGAIKVNSKIDKGTIFNVYLPLMDKNVGAEVLDVTEGLPKGCNERILLVDDEEAIVKLEKLMLERLGYKVTSRVSSVEALEAFKGKPGDFDIVIMDMNMPHMTGVQLAEKITSIRPDIPIIIFTGFSERINEEKAKRMGMKGLLMKPVIKSEMAKTVRQVLDEAKKNTQHA